MVTLETLAELRMSDERRRRRQGGPVIPDFGKASDCVARRTGWFCTDWVRDNWGDTLQPALVEHIELT